MIPLKDDTPRFTTPYVTWFLLLLNVVIFLLEEWVQHGPQGRLASEQLAMVFGLVPVKIPIALAGGQVPLRLIDYLGTRTVSLQAAFLPILTSMFLHSGWWHIISNMWVLWIFGDNVEDYLGHFVYLLFYLGAGIAGALLHVMFNWGSVIPTVGASGAIAGVMGAYFVLYPRARVLTLVPFFFVFFLWLPAWIVLGYWFLAQFLGGAATAIGTAHSTTTGGVAFWAHVGGFLTGLLLIKLLPHKQRLYRYSGWN
ncbi:MAG TPA: rhomboid family intramembrane serine protease [Candidatus Koribacter sp.]|jgi:membrane associated rhomboid family serine protease